MHKYHPYSITPSKWHPTGCVHGWEPDSLPTTLSGRWGRWPCISSCSGPFYTAACLTAFGGTQLSDLSKML